MHISIALNVVKQNLVAVDHFIALLSVLIARLDLKNDAITCWSVSKLKFHARFVLERAFLGKIQEISRLEVLKLDAHAVNDWVAFGVQNGGGVVYNLGFFAFIKNCTFFVQLFERLLVV